MVHIAADESQSFTRLASGRACPPAIDFRSFLRYLKIWGTLHVGIGTGAIRVPKTKAETGSWFWHTMRLKKTTSNEKGAVEVATSTMSYDVGFTTPI